MEFKGQNAPVDFNSSQCNYDEKVINHMNSRNKDNSCRTLLEI